MRALNENNSPACRFSLTRVTIWLRPFPFQLTRSRNPWLDPACTRLDLIQFAAADGRLGLEIYRRRIRILIGPGQIAVRAAEIERSLCVINTQKCPAYSGAHTTRQTYRDQQRTTCNLIMALTREGYAICDANKTAPPAFLFGQTL